MKLTINSYRYGPILTILHNQLSINPYRYSPILAILTGRQLLTNTITVSPLHSLPLINARFCSPSIGVNVLKESP